jgi:hypothetical protein
MATAKDDVLSQFEMLETATLTVENPRGGDLLNEGKPVTITVYGPGSKEHIRAKHKLDNDAQARSVAILRGRPDKNAAEANLKSSAEFLAACTVDIANFPITNAYELYSNPKLRYIADQVDRFLAGTENFMPA